MAEISEDIPKNQTFKEFYEQLYHHLPTQGILGMDRFAYARFFLMETDLEKVTGLYFSRMPSFKTDFIRKHTEGFLGINIDEAVSNLLQVYSELDYYNSIK